MCIQMFEQWSETDQVEFVEHLISRMCHYQHGHINSYLKPMLQRDFITALPGTHISYQNSIVQRLLKAPCKSTHVHLFPLPTATERLY